MHDGAEAYSGDFWKPPRGPENESAGTTAYDLETVDLDAGDYRIDAGVRVCPASGCSDADLGEPATRCDGQFQVHTDELTILTVVVRDLDSRCRFAVG